MLEYLRHQKKEDKTLMDLLMVVGLVVIFGLILGFITWCDKQVKDRG